MSEDRRARLQREAQESYAKEFPRPGSYAAGRLAGLREAAEVVRSHIQPQGDGRLSDDYMAGWAAGANYTAEQNRARILALAEGGEG